MRVGFIIGLQLNEIRLLNADRPTGGSLGTMRYQWIADEVNADPTQELTYEMYRPWRRYDVLVFMKAMGAKCMRLLNRQQGRGHPAVFDANVNYYENEGTFHFDGMQHSSQQMRDVNEISATADAIIADSPYLTTICQRINPRTLWIPDNVNMRIVPPYQPWTRRKGEPLPLLWSGQAHKLFELFAIEDVLRKYKRHIRLIMVTNSLDLQERWNREYRLRFQALLADLDHQIIPFESIPQLMQTYTNGGVCISPRFLDNSYNKGHTEWKITLGMACGRMVLASPLSSYLGVKELANGRGIRICDTSNEWAAALDEILAEDLDIGDEERSALDVVQQHYASKVIAKRHAAFVKEVAKNHALSI
jgi:hypothetical protein